MSYSKVASPVWIFIGFVLISTAACVMLALPDEQRSTQSVITWAIMLIVFFLIGGLLYRRKNALTRVVASQLAVLAGYSHPQDEDIDQIQNKVVRSSWIFLLGAIPPVGLLFYALLK